jgi:ribonucleoside-diphosphate reductase beta chain
MTKRKKNSLGKGSVNFNAEFKASTRTNSDIINARKMINGDDDGLMQVSPLKHAYSYEVFQKMLANTWVPQEVEMALDVAMWNKPDALTEQEKKVYSRSLAFVSNLDGIQTDNLAVNIMRQITSPEVRLVISRQISEEAIHVFSYATMIEALGLDPEEVYGLYRKDRALYKKNAYVLSSLKTIADPNFKTGTLENDRAFVEAIVANIILEGIYFYSAFLIFYVLRRNNKMPASAEMIQFINRDEDLHLDHFIYIYNTIKEEQPEIFNADFEAKLLKNVVAGVEMEIGWGISCIGEGILGLNATNLTQYLYFVGNMRLQAIGLPKAWPEATNPFPWIDELTQGAMTETNFFEGTVREYATGTLNWE